MSAVVELLKELVAIPSMNPMEKMDASGAYCEHYAAEFVAEELKRTGLDVEIYDVEPNRPNVVAMMDVHAERTLMLEAHLDTVHAEGMTVAPFVPLVKDGRVYGRGACDTKGSLAAFMTAIGVLAEQRKGMKFNVMLAAAVDEESGFKGAASLVGRGMKADMAIVGEPTQLHIVRAHKGVVRWRVHTTGLAAHSAYPRRGRNAIYTMGRVIQRLESHASALEEIAPHADLGTPSLSIGTISGGRVVNIVPDRCTIEVDRRTLPGESKESVLALARAALEDVTEWGFEPPFLAIEGIDVDLHAPIVALLSEAIEQVTGPAIVECAHYATDAGHYNRAGIPSIVFGPGDIAQAHTADEYIDAAQLEQAVAIITRLIGE
ncbi:MAG TPA: M20 family metallopeptidase [Bacteroidota bacterium]|nr:M20 family metallopeptidase [Bacteroidota bacterium]